MTVTFYPYGCAAGAPDAPGARLELELGAAAITDRDRSGLEHYSLYRSGEDWLLCSRSFDGPLQLLARSPVSRLPASALDAAEELLLELWSLRLPSRRRFERMRQCGKLGRARWQRVAAQLRPMLEDRLRAEGHTVRRVTGPMGTEEHLLLFPGRAHPTFYY